MALMKEGGSIDIERINRLPLEEYMEEIGSLTNEQFKEYISSLPDGPKGPTRAVEVDYTLEDELKRGAVIAEDYIKMMRDKHGRNNGKD